MTMPMMSLRPVGVQRTAAARPSRVAVQTRRIIAVRASPVRSLPAWRCSELVKGEGSLMQVAAAATAYS
jgi:hypothetical protein